MSDGPMAMLDTVMYRGARHAGGRAGVKYYALAALAIGALLLALFGLAQLLEIPLLSEESPELGGAGVGAGGASFAAGRRCRAAPCRRAR